MKADIIMMRKHESSEEGVFEIMQIYSRDVNGLFSSSSFFLSWALGFGWSSNGGAALVDLAKVVHGELWSLDDLDLGNKDRLDLHDRMALLDNFTLDLLFDNGLAKVLNVGGLGLGLHDRDHGLADGAALGLLSIASLLVLVEALGEADSEHADDELISGADVNLSFNESAVLAHDRGKFISAEAHAGEVGKDIVLFDIDDLPVEKAVGVRLLFSKIAVGKFENTVLDIVGWSLAASGLMRNCETNVSLLEKGWNEDVTPFLLEERILLDLLGGFAAGLLRLTHVERAGPKPSGALFPKIQFTKCDSL